MPQLYDYQIYSYHLAFQRPVHLKQGVLKQRQGLILKSVEPDGRSRYAEVAPFPGLNTESLKDCIQQLQALQDLTEPPKELKLFPSVAWGLFVLQQAQSLPDLSQLPLNALLTEPRLADLQREAQQAYERGYRCMKLKVGLGEQNRDLERIQMLQAHFPELVLRLDANRSWTLAESLAFLEALPETIEYLEEPLQNPKDYSQLGPRMSEFSCGLALDESLWEADFKNYLPHARTLVLKPMRMGPERVQACLLGAQSHGQHCVFSSVFESDLGLRSLALFAAKHSTHSELAQGLDTWRAFSQTLTTEAFGNAIAKGQIQFQNKVFTTPPALRYAYLKSIE